MYKAKAKARPRQMTSKTSPFGAPFKRGSVKPKGRAPLGEKKYTYHSHQIMIWSYLPNLRKDGCTRINIQRDGTDCIHPQIAVRAPLVARGGVLSGAQANSKKKKKKNTIKKKKKHENHPILAWFHSIGNVFKVPLQSLELQRWVKKPFWNVQLLWTFEFDIFNHCEV